MWMQWSLSFSHIVFGTRRLYQRLLSAWTPSPNCRGIERAKSSAMMHVWLSKSNQESSSLRTETSARLRAPRLLRRLERQQRAANQANKSLRRSLLQHEFHVMIMYERKADQKIIPFTLEHQINYAPFSEPIVHEKLCLIFPFRRLFCSPWMNLSWILLGQTRVFFLKFTRAGCSSTSPQSGTSFILIVRIDFKAFLEALGPLCHTTEALA